MLSMLFIALYVFCFRGLLIIANIFIIYLNDWGSNKFDKRNSIFNKIQENNQKISLILLKPMELKDKILVDHLARENTTYYVS